MSGVTIRTVPSMASTSSRPATRASRGTERAPRSVPNPRRLLLVATVAVVLGSFLPWIATAVGNVSGARGAGLWTFYAAMLGLTGAFVPWQRVAAAQAAILAVVAIALPVWQVVHLLTLVGVGGWLPGIGLVAVLGGGIAAAVASWRLAHA